MNNIVKKYILKIPKNTLLYYCSTNQVVIVSNSKNYINSEKKLRKTTYLLVNKRN